MDIVRDLEDSKLVSVYEVIGEPATLIYGVPPLPSESPAPVQLPTKARAGDECDSCFGVLLEGRKIKKFFGDRYYSGKIDKYDEEEKWYRVTYEDSDFEDLEWNELEEVLVPLNISIPLTSLALQKCETDGAASLPRTGSARTRKRLRKSLDIVDTTLELLQPSEAEPSAEKLQEIGLKTIKELEHDT